MLISLLRNRRPPLTISESDIEAALAHLCSLPYQESMPKMWERKHLLNMIREAIPKNPKVGQCFDVAPGVYGVIKPFGVDLLHPERLQGNNRLQIWLLIRHCGTDPTKITEV